MQAFNLLNTFPYRVQEIPGERVNTYYLVKEEHVIATFEGPKRTAYHYFLTVIQEKCCNEKT